jgi:hypothetical protein
MVAVITAVLAGSAAGLLAAVASGHSLVAGVVVAAAALTGLVCSRDTPRPRTPDPFAGLGVLLLRKVQAEFLDCRRDHRRSLAVTAGRRRWVSLLHCFIQVHRAGVADQPEPGHPQPRADTRLEQLKYSTAPASIAALASVSTT